jgi:hypothetical protein
LPRTEINTGFSGADNLINNKQNNVMIHTLNACEKLISKYVNVFGGEMVEIEEGCLGLGKILLHSAPNKKTIVIEEVYLNSWSSGHKVRMYNVTPKKYTKYTNQ